ncbi:type VII secretion-associated serine protease mycosin [Krasilnikovia cinnamomea]|uniref:Type VII secretion-associated serine protease mycosin n=1 Tax=Krasilnikovia cinnamomea TaxID=349313 RepID=A0A4V2G6H1_9ACTN|nr:S8 family serine peptidase [Krasilnikovia cinnamomea]RZU48666.1 type VII secretion-associated serine protease mycosin [Krasilnikovia cinnamomea]
MIRRIAAGAVTALVLIGVSPAPAAADRVRDAQWHLSDLKIAEAHRITRGEGVVVALIDTGVDAKHRDLAGAVLPGHNTRRGKYAGDPTGRDDSDGHGTEMAGLIAGRGHGSGAGVLGIAPAAKLLPISTQIGSWGNVDLKGAVDFAIAHRAGVINMSFGGPDDEAKHEAIRTALAHDIVVVAASGNRGQGGGDYPGMYPEVLTVGAYSANRKIAEFSVTGPQVDLVAPGDRLVTTGISESGYRRVDGTSESTAVVSGAAALIRAKYPRMSAAEVVHRLTATADDAGAPGRDDTYGYGRLNVVQALTADVAPLPEAPPVSAAPSSAAAPAEPEEPVRASKVDPRDLPRATSPLTVSLIAAGILLAGAAVLAVIFWRRRQRS